MGLMDMLFHRFIYPYDFDDRTFVRPDRVVCATRIADTRPDGNF
jgi:hypothetical protein